MVFSQRIVSSFIERHRRAGVVASGPFRGVLATETARDHFWLELLGFYEFYLHEAIEVVLSRKPPLVVDVGAADGYYTLGFASRLPGARHVSFEMLEDSRDALRRCAQKLGTPIEIRGLCRPEDLVEVVGSSKRGFLLMDCEGAERELLGGGVVPLLAEWTVLLEVHDGHAPGVGEEIRQRYSSSHDIEVIWTRDATAGDFRAVLPWPLNHYCKGVMRRTCGEGRGVPMRFFFMTPRANNGGRGS